MAATSEKDSKFSYIEKMKIDISDIDDLLIFSNCCLPVPLTLYFERQGIVLGNFSSRDHLYQRYQNLRQNKTLFGNLCSDIQNVINGHTTFTGVFNAYLPRSFIKGDTYPEIFIMLACWLSLVFYEQNMKSNENLFYYESKFDHLEGCRKFIVPRKLQSAKKPTSTITLKDDPPPVKQSSPDLETPAETDANNEKLVEGMLVKLEVVKDLATDIGKNWKNLPDPVQRTLHGKMVEMGLSRGFQSPGDIVCILLVDY